MLIQLKSVFLAMTPSSPTGTALYTTLYTTQSTEHSVAVSQSRSRGDAAGQCGLGLGGSVLQSWHWHWYTQYSEFGESAQLVPSPCWKSPFTKVCKLLVGEDFADKHPNLRQRYHVKSPILKCESINRHFQHGEGASTCLPQILWIWMYTSMSKLPHSAGRWYKAEL